MAMLRRGLGALVRAFAHQSRREDERVLETAASASPLIHWAMRYAGAVIAIDSGRSDHARELLVGSPDVAGGERIPGVPPGAGGEVGLESSRRDEPGGLRSHFGSYVSSIAAHK